MCRGKLAQKRVSTQRSYKWGRGNRIKGATKRQRKKRKRDGLLNENKAETGKVEILGRKRGGRDLKNAGLRAGEEKGISKKATGNQKINREN